VSSCGQHRLSTWRATVTITEDAVPSFHDDLTLCHYQICLLTERRDWSVEICIFELDFKQLKRIGLYCFKPFNGYDKGIRCEQVLRKCVCPVLKLRWGKPALLNLLPLVNAWNMLSMLKNTKLRVYIIVELLYMYCSVLQCYVCVYTYMYNACSYSAVARPVQFTRRLRPRSSVQFMFIFFWIFNLLIFITLCS
jgi:hypothetical protein